MEILIKKTWFTALDINIKIGKVEKKILDSSGLVTTFGLNTKIAAAENKVPDACVLLKKNRIVTLKY